MFKFVVFHIWFIANFFGYIFLCMMATFGNITKLTNPKKKKTHLFNKYSMGQMIVNSWILVLGGSLVLLVTSGFLNIFRI
jgi:hypothetical protein